MSRAPTTTLKMVSDTKLLIECVDYDELESIKKNEQSDMKGNLNAEVVKEGLFPLIGPVNFTYTVIILIFQMITAFIFPFRLAFLPEKEFWSFVILDFVTDFVFLCNMIITFFMPVFEDSTLITKKKQIAKKYLTGWFWIDLYCLLPLSMFRMLSMKNPRNKDNLHNLMTLNFKSLPRFYPMLVIIRMTRMRFVEDNLHKVLKKTSLAV